MGEYEITTHSDTRRQFLMDNGKIRTGERILPLTNAQFAQGLRELAEIYESDDRMQQPEQLNIFLISTPTFRASVAALANGGRVEKVPPRDENEFLYHVKRTLPSGLVVDLSTVRSSVCRRVQKMQLVETWECPDSILDPEAE